MQVHVDTVKFKTKPEGAQIGGIKSRLAEPRSIRDMSVEQIARALVSGQTVQPGVCPFSEESRREGKKGTCREDFRGQTLFMCDIDNDDPSAPQETPEHIDSVLASHGIKAAFMYESFGSSPQRRRFRFAVACNREITDEGERARIQAGLNSLSPQCDSGCINADRIFFGTDKGLIDRFTDFGAFCDKALLTALDRNEQRAVRNVQWRAERSPVSQNVNRKTQNARRVSGAPIPEGCRHTTLVSFAAGALKRYGASSEAFAAYTDRVASCVPPLPDAESRRIWSDAVRFYETKIATSPGYCAPRRSRSAQ